VSWLRTSAGLDDGSVLGIPIGTQAEVAARRTAAAATRSFHTFQRMRRVPVRIRTGTRRVSAPG
jgi:hypothetical protein